MTGKTLAGLWAAVDWAEGHDTSMACISVQDLRRLLECLNSPQVTSFLGHDLTYWAELEAQAKANCVDFSAVIEVIVTLRRELSNSQRSAAQSEKYAVENGKALLIVQESLTKKMKEIEDLKAAIGTLEHQSAFSRGDALHWKNIAEESQTKIEKLKNQLACAVSGYQNITSSQRKVIENLREHLNVANTWKKSAEIYHDKLQQIADAIVAAKGCRYNFYSMMKEISNILFQVFPPLKRPE